MRIVRNNDENGNNTDKHFRELRNLETPPSGDLWDKLEYRLDGERERVKHDHWYKALIALLIPFTVINLLFTYDLTDYYSGASTTKEHFSKKQFHLPGNFYSSTYSGYNGGWGYSFKGFSWPETGTMTETRNRNISKEMHLLETAVASTENSITLPEHRPFGTNENVTSETVMPLERKMLEISATADDITNHRAKQKTAKGLGSVKGFHIGIEGGINNYWMMHKNNSLHPLIGNRIHRKFDFAGTYGISAGYDFSNKYGIEAEWIIQSKQGQQYHELRYGKIPINGEVNLEYMHVPVMFKYKWTKAPVRCSYSRVLNLVAGVQYSRLRGSSVVQNGLDLKDVDDLFNRDELGLLLGIEYDIFVHRNYFFSVGGRASISTDARSFPYFCSEKAETYNALIGVTASFNYLAKRKQKADN